RAPGGLGVASDGVDVTAERRPLREERQSDEEEDDDDAREREPERVALDVGVVADRDGSEACCRDPEHLRGYEALVPDRDPGPSLAHDSAGYGERVDAGDDR